MKTTLAFLLSLASLTLVGCRTPRAGDYFERQDIRVCITLVETGKMVCDGEVKDIPDGLIVPETIEDYDYARKYFENKEYRLFKCLRFDDCE